MELDGKSFPTFYRLKSLLWFKKKDGSFLSFYSFEGKKRDKKINPLLSVYHVIQNVAPLVH